MLTADRFDIRFNSVKLTADTDYRGATRKAVVGFGIMALLPDRHVGGRDVEISQQEQIAEIFVQRDETDDLNTCRAEAAKELSEKLMQIAERVKSDSAVR